MAKFTKDQLMQLAEIHLIEVDGIEIDVHIQARWANLWAYCSGNLKSVVSELIIYPENLDQGIQNFLEKVKQVNHD